MKRMHGEESLKTVCFDSFSLHRSQILRDF
jgi:hypothetical protein